ncbi:MAG: TolC family protein [Phycisphaerae bacterium]|jgi:cobalt-zinc-cadmium efflux system outer membrane protein|nr:TolC family protein [Phycisphaerae bacterium]
MYLRHVLSIALISAVCVIGCDSSNVGQSWPTPRPLGQDIKAYLPTRGPSEPEAELLAIKEPTGALTLRQALVLVLARSPELAAVSWQVRAAEARILQAGAMPNPEVRIRVDDFGGSGNFSGTRNSDQTLRVTQPIELGRKALRRREVAQLEAALDGWDYEAKRLDVFTDTTKAFVVALAAQRRLALAEESHGRAERVFAAISEGVKAGTTTLLVETRARVEVGTSRVELERAKYAMAAAQAALATYWGTDEPKFAQVDGDFETLAEVPAFEILRSKVESNPDVARWGTEARLRGASVKLAKANSIPDIQVFGGARREEDSSDYGFTIALEVEVPIYDRNQGRIREAEFNRIKAAHERRAATVAATAALRQAHKALAAAHTEATMLKNDVLPAAQRALDTAREGLQERLLTELDLLRAERTLFEVKARQVGALAAYHTAAIEVERLIGQPLSSLKAP